MKQNKKIKIEIKHWITGSILFEYEVEDNTLVKTIRGANLRGANLRGANLWGANLRGANLRGANLWRAKNLNLYWHIHHQILVEKLNESLKNRIEYIKKEKGKTETKEQIKLRLKLLKKVKTKPTDWPNTEKGWERLHRIECKNCPWDGKTIFGRKDNG